MTNFSNTPANIDQINHIGVLVTEAVQSAHEQGFESYKLTTVLTKQPNGYSLSPFSVHNGVKVRNASFKIPNVFAPIIADPAAAKKNGTIFFPVSNKPISDHDTHICIQDLYPVAPTHVLIIPKQQVEALPDLAQQAMGELYSQAAFVALQTLRLTQATLTINVYPPNQEVPQVHLHLMSQEKFAA